jgi:hypothetical protein
LGRIANGEPATALSAPVTSSMPNTEIVLAERLATNSNVPFGCTASACGMPAEGADPDGVSAPLAASTANTLTLSWAALVENRNWPFGCVARPAGDPPPANGAPAIGDRAPVAESTA